VTFTAVTNLNTAISLNLKNDRLHKVTIPFSYQFSFRYLYGKDLEFDGNKLNAAQGYLSDSIGLSDYVVAVTIKPSKKGDKEIEIYYNPDINRELYAEITDIDSLRK
jgi:hypothetical protein